MGSEDRLKGGEVRDLGGNAREVAENPGRVRFRHRRSEARMPKRVCGSHNHVVKVKLSIRSKKGDGL